MTLTDTDRHSVALYPELGRLVELREGYRWVFDIKRDDDGLVTLVAAGRLWPNRWSDALAIRDRGDVHAFRLDADGGEVWKYDGGLADTIDKLTELPEPGHRLAPRLVHGRPRTLWLPPSARGAR